MKDLSSALPESPVSDWHMPRLPHIKIPRFHLQTPDSAERVVIESYIRERFAAVHKAEKPIRRRWVCRPPAMANYLWSNIFLGR